MSQNMYSKLYKVRKDKARKVEKEIKEEVNKKKNNEMGSKYTK
jgi:hypothetical protein